MSDMSFKQAKELTEQFELAEVSLSQTIKKLDLATKNFEKSLVLQEKILRHKPQVDKKLEVMKIVVGVNIGFILGLVVAKFII